ncbi:MAG: Membrane protein insertase, YidC/Oxa1 family [Candidatus Beckwithbacteria bacterium GW2011_GWC2_47_9]|uniref:Membrane protein insertase, YidC/Oxa1 family n=1 Tax=Candidatus Beckwithbacteria bacterium GW2011_GWC2_47_9 TaxID=1618373 RepID=A0A0G1U1C4_9BACT|nr:MAG: Membrane protein insertase, YidC/Oxa1 family [Candidatus Beckwithbacteria bacterium GW2011_GWC2_47_9]
MWFSLFYQPLVNALIFFYNLMGGNLGWAIIGLTIAIRLLLTPLTLPSLKSAQKLKTLQPELNKLKEKFGGDKQAWAKKQLEFYQQNGVNPAAGCLPQIVQIVILIALFQAFNQVLTSNGNVVENLNKILYAPLRLQADAVINNRFTYLNLTQPDLFNMPAINLFGFTLNKFPGIFLLVSAVTQFISSKLMMPAAAKVKTLAEKTKEQGDDMAAAMQQQMLYLMPVMTLFIGFKFASGLVLYWLTFSLVMLVQQLLLNHGQTKKA